MKKIYYCNRCKKPFCVDLKGRNHSYTSFALENNKYNLRKVIKKEEICKGGYALKPHYQNVELCNNCEKELELILNDFMAIKHNKDGVVI